MTTLVKTAPLVSIVDDDEPVREATSNLLEACGYVTATFASADEFLQSDHVDKTACLVTDLRMPGTNGIELQQRLREAGWRIPTIVVTAHPEEHMRRAAMNIGALAFLPKPVSDERLLSYLELAFAGG